MRDDTSLDSLRVRLEHRTRLTPLLGLRGEDEGDEAVVFLDSDADVIEADAEVLLPSVHHVDAPMGELLVQLVLEGRSVLGEDDRVDVKRERHRCVPEFLDALVERLFFGMLARVGLREGELQALEWRDIDLKNGSLRLDENKMRISVPVNTRFGQA